MHSSFAILSLFFAQVSWGLGSDIADYVHHEYALKPRTASASGGWALSLPGVENSNNCPTSTSICGSFNCCPVGMTCDTNLASVTSFCCSDPESCINIPNAVTCADDTWGLWNASDPSQHGSWLTETLFCCLPGQIGLQNATCAASDQKSTIPSSSLAAEVSAPSSTSASAEGGPTSTAEVTGAGAGTSVTAIATAATTSGKSSTASSTSTGAAASGTAKSSAGQSRMETEVLVGGMVVGFLISVL